jgi:hypothetical protein
MYLGNIIDIVINMKAVTNMEKSSKFLGSI